MKTLLTTFFVLCAAAAFGQSAPVMSSEISKFSMTEHSAHADYHDMGTEHSLFDRGGFSYAQGERPLWEFGPVSTPTPLGDVARAYRKEKETAKKAEIKLEKQGS